MDRRRPGSLDAARRTPSAADEVDTAAFNPGSLPPRLTPTTTLAAFNPGSPHPSVGRAA